MKKLGEIPVEPQDHLLFRVRIRPELVPLDVVCRKRNRYQVRYAALPQFFPRDQRIREIKFVAVRRGSSPYQFEKLRRAFRVGLALRLRHAATGVERPRPLRQCSM